ncbi:MAG: PqqD family protein [Novosphingobium sp.]
MNLTDTFALSDDVVAREVGGETMLLDLASGTYFGLDPIGGRLWSVLEQGGTLAQACEQMAGDYDVARDVLETDMLALVGQLVEKRLLVTG